MQTSIYEQIIAAEIKKFDLIPEQVVKGYLKELADKNYFGIPYQKPFPPLTGKALDNLRREIIAMYENRTIKDLPDNSHSIESSSFLSHIIDEVSCSTAIGRDIVEEAMSDKNFRRFHFRRNR